MNLPIPEPWPFREHNDCHDAETGEFCSRGYLKADVAATRAAGWEVRAEHGRLQGEFHRGVVKVRAHPNEPRDRVLSVLRHERGHGEVMRSIQDQDRLNLYPVTFTKPKGGTHKALYHNSVFSDEYLAWKNAIKGSKRLRVDWPSVTSALTAYAKEERISKKTLDRALRTLKRYARFGRRVRRA